MRPIGVFGGTFDPIHYGHLRTALELRVLLDLAAVHFVPCANPPHRTMPMTDGRLRLRMVEAAIRGEAGWQVPTTGLLGALLKERGAKSVAELAALPAGRIHVLPVTQLEISSTDLRDSLRARRDPKFLVPDSVREIIVDTECYAESL